MCAWSKKKKKAGRPKLSRDLLRSENLHPSFTKSEYQMIDDSRGSYDITAYARDLILKGVDKKMKGGK